ncbi:LAGLIDADG family homing endonuclease [Haloarcula salinisoli]|uniref:DNA helicase n=1 Tax=Haloarcula salinisoli TaxID=2487746 RepID=A0A8J7YJB7_9EURY|nr:LAGLIDADG family homing endonuclease [Halomicroarcula salinisoli]MBX0286862.1 helix-turn-helix domain-containing protein [Halomicroarcula salinisoli]MBX0304164.1 helix-turn-helix domain-containing protein [Halomicroarcula salinisoli]
MATAENTELIDRFEEFYRNYYRNEIGELAQKYPNDQKSLYIDWDDLYRFDQDLADDYRTKPSQLQEFAEEALRLYDLPVDVSLGQAHVRVRNLPESEDIRDIRHEHHGNLISVQGIVRKATDVRPKVTEAAFECQRCGTLSRIPQTAGDFQEPHECQGCERQGPFRLNTDQSQFIDAQKIRVQESPEGLRGGETPQSIDINVEDDITGTVTAGDHVRATGILKLDQQGSDQDKSPMFDIYMDGVSIVIEDEQFEDMDITDADKKEIVELSNEADIYDQMVGAIAPSIYGYEKEKLAMMLQLFSGVTKELPDGSRIRGDLHMLLIGDPGTGKCQKFDTKVMMADGTERQLGELVESHLDDPKEIDDGVYQETNFEVQTVGDDGSVTTGSATKVWKREAPETLYEIQTQSGRSVTVTPSHPLFVQSDLSLSARRADELSQGDFLAVPGWLRGDWDNTLNVDHRCVDQPNANSLNTPERVTPPLSRLLGYVIAEGHITDGESNGSVTVTNADEEIIEETIAAIESLGLRATRRTHHTNDAVELACCSSVELVEFFRELEPAMLDASAEQRVPECLFRATPANKRAFLRAYVDSEGTVSPKEREIAIGSVSRDLLEGVQTLLLTFGITSHLEARSGGSYRLRISGEDFVTYLDQIGFVTARKTNASAAFDGTSRNTNTEIVPNLSTDLKRIREALALSQFDCGVPRTTYQHYERGDRNPGCDSLLNVIETFEQRLQWFRDARERVENGEWNDVEDLRTELNISQADLATGMDVTQTAVSYYERNDAIPDGGVVSDAKEAVLQRIDRGLSVSTDVQRLRTLATGDIEWDPITSIEEIETAEEWVYDLEIEGTHNYVSNGVVSHNSQMLSYIEQIAPRSVYTSGKGSSSAGLTAAAVRDDFGDGQQWTLEAGALVLADQGIAAVDELDKMSPEDRSAMHEALEQQRISVSKAGINATLKSRCSLLGAANPKYGRFDQYEPIGEQIDLEPALISRFDLIFTVTDKPDEEKDRDLAEHIVQTNYAGELHTHRTNNPTSNYTEEEVDTVTDEVAPTIEPELLRKYIAYSKRNCFPTMTEEAKTRIEDFYVDLRMKGQDEDAPVPVTARKLEALVRLAEASARIRLSDTVEESDADRAVEIAHYCLKEIGVDPETGEFDADVVETGTSKTQRDRIQNIRGIINDIEDEYDEGAPIDVVVERAEEVGIDESKAEHEIEKLKQRGEVYEPRTDHLRTT